MSSVSISCDVVQGIDRAGVVRHLLVLETANQVEQGIDLAHVTQEAIAESFALAGAFDEAGDVHHLQHARHDLARAGEARDLVKRRVRHRRAPHVGLDGAEGIVADLGRAARDQRVEERGLAHIGQAHDAAPKPHPMVPRAFRRRPAPGSIPAAGRGARPGS